MKTISFTEARGQFKNIVDAAAKGDVIRITRNGKTVAELRPPVEAELEYWKSVKPLNIGKGGLSQLLIDERQSSR